MVPAEVIQICPAPFAHREGLPCKIAVGIPEYETFGWCRLQGAFGIRSEKTGY